MPEMLKTLPHIAYEVDDLGAELKGAEVLLEPFTPMEGVTVAFIIEAVRDSDTETLLLPIGKLTNIALALREAPDIADRVRILWLGSNYPLPGEYNQDNDESALRYLLDLDVPFEIALVRAGGTDGTAAVTVALGEIRERMAGLGPATDPPVTGRDGGEFATFGDYSVDLFERAVFGDDGAVRALYDLAAVAIVRDPGWATATEIPAPDLVDGAWIERPENPRTITLWSGFDRDAIAASMYAQIEAAVDRP